MSCCGRRRRQWSRPSAPAAVAGPPPAPLPERAGVAFEYVGASALTVRGPITRRLYRFGGPGARVAVDRRDAAGVAGVPKLRRL